MATGTQSRGGAQGATATRNQNQNQSSTANATDTAVSFMTVAEFKSAIGAEKLEVLRNPQTDKLFMSADGGANYKVQQDIDVNADIRVLVPEDGGLEQACLVNVEGGAEVLTTL